MTDANFAALVMGHDRHNEVETLEQLLKGVISLEEGLEGMDLKTLYGQPSKGMERMLNSLHHQAEVFVYHRNNNGIVEIGATIEHKNDEGGRVITSRGEEILFLYIGEDKGTVSSNIQSFIGLADAAKDKGIHRNVRDYDIITSLRAAVEEPGIDECTEKLMLRSYGFSKDVKPLEFQTASNADPIRVIMHMEANYPGFQGHYLVSPNLILARQPKGSIDGNVNMLLYPILKKGPIEPTGILKERLIEKYTEPYSEVAIQIAKEAGLEVSRGWGDRIHEKMTVTGNPSQICRYRKELEKHTRRVLRY